MVLKIPPPPPIATQDHAFNRWLLEITAILNASGGIDPTSITGLEAAYANIATLQGEVATLNTEVGGNTGNISTLQVQVTTINGQIVTINGQITTLSARNQVLNGAGVPAAGLGNNGDLYLNNTGGAGTRLYGKITGAWQAIA